MIRPTRMLQSLLVMVVALCVLATPAMAGLDSSVITEPADGSYILADTPGQTVTISGTTQGSAIGSIALRCYFGESSLLVDGSVTVNNDTFSEAVPAAVLDHQRCVLRAVPQGDTYPKVPGGPSPYVGPRIAPGVFATGTFSGGSGNPNNGAAQYWNWAQAGATHNIELYDAGTCGVASASAFDPITLAPGFSTSTWACASFFDWRDEATVPTRSSIVVDGHNAYLPFAWFSFPQRFPAADVHPPTLAVTGRTLDPVSGRMTVDEVQRPARCSGDVFPPTAAQCMSAVSSGVQLTRHTETLRGGQETRFTDTWTSTDGLAHTIDLLPSAINANADYQSGIASTLAPVSIGQTVPFDATKPASVVVAPYAATGASPGSVVFDPPPADATFFSDATWHAHYALTVPAIDSVVLRTTWITAPDLSTAQDLAEATVDEEHPPTVAFDQPANGAIVTSTSVLAMGTTADPDATSSAAVTVNGVAATVTADGHWSATVPLAVGANTLTATATDTAGNTAAATRTVHRQVPPDDGTKPGTDGTKPGTNGTKPGTDGTKPQGRDVTAPVLSGVALSRRSFRVGKKATAGLASVQSSSTLRWTVNEPATAAFTVYRVTAGRKKGKSCVAPAKAPRRAKSCQRLTKVTVLKPLAATAGKHTLTYTGRVGKKALAIGSYQMQGRATDLSKNVSKVRTVSFKVVR